MLSRPMRAISETLADGMAKVAMLCVSVRAHAFLFLFSFLPGGLRDLSTVKCARNISDVPADIIESNRQHRFPSALGA